MKILKTSPSNLEIYASCPYCWYLKSQGYPQKTSPAMKFGTRLHRAIQEYHTQLIPIFDDDLKPYLDEYMAIYTQDYQTCEEFWRVKLFDTDIDFNLKIDLIKDDLLIDHKTSARAYRQEYIDSQRQVTAYAWAWSQLYSEPPKAIRFNVFSTNPKPESKLLEVFETSRSKEDFETWESWVREILKGIEADYFDPGDGRWHNYEACPKYKEKGGDFYEP